MLYKPTDKVLESKRNIFIGVTFFQFNMVTTWTLLKGRFTQTFSLEFAENVATKLNNPNYNVIEFFLIKSGIPDAC